ncbi:MAG: family 10 glycosylhydrolase [Fimbriimonadaceae bacterium]|nr:family 10 glycosylhydrolase [Fimbriimonadaceae bacterium]
MAILPWRSLPQFTEPSFAYRAARDRGLQGRLLWIDGTANIDLVADRARLGRFMKQAKDVGFNTVVYDIKPIVGRTLYPSEFAAPLTSWKGVAFPPGYNPLAEVLQAGHHVGLNVCVSMNAFSEGHSYAKAAVGKPDSPFGDAGPGYRWPERQAVVLRSEPDPMDPTKAAYTFRPSGAVQNQIPLMMNPFDQLVRDHVLVMVDEVARGYPIDGLLFDDRLRFTGLDGGFSPEARSALERKVGAVAWPEDVYTVRHQPDKSTTIIPGKYFQDWLVVRAEAVKSFVTRARAVLKRARPAASFGVYAGSSYGHYYKFGSNYGSPDNRAGFPFLTSDYRKAGFAPWLDLLVTGCYYPTPTVASAQASGKPVGFTVEAGALVSVAAAYDATWTYAGVMLTDYTDRPAALETALRAATTNSEGVMVFDASHGIDKFWPVFAKVFAKPAKAPHNVPGLIDKVRRARLRADRRGEAVWNFPMLDGQADAGF